MSIRNEPLSGASDGAALSSEHEQRFRTLIEHSSDAIALLDSKGHFLYVSPSVQHFLGFTPEELVGRNGFELVPAEELAHLTEQFAVVLSDPGHSVTVEHHYFHKNGSMRCLESTVTNWLHEPGIEAIVSNFRDITVRKQTEALLTGEKDALQLMVQGASLAQVLEVLARLVEEQSGEDVLTSVLLVDADGRHLRHIAAPSLPPSYTQAIDGLAIGPSAGSCGTAAYRNEAVYVSDIATDPRWTDFKDLALPHGLSACWSTPIRTSNNHVLGTFALYYRAPHLPSSHDQQLIDLVTHTAAIAIERKQREEDHYRLAAIVESSNDAIVGKTLDGIITSWNSAAERLFGYSAAEAIGKHITLIIPPELHLEEVDIISRLRRGIRIQHYETTRVRKDGSSVHVSLSISPIKDSQGQIIGAAKIARDISEQKELERRKDEFISMASHELKTPVTSLKGFTQLLSRRFKQRGDKENARFLGRMDAQLDKLTKLISELLDITKMQGGQLEYREQLFDLHTLVQEITEQVQATSSSHRLVLENLEQVQVFGDRDRIGQVVINLLTNAMKYSPDAQEVIVRVVADRQKSNAIVSVQDFGIGIAEKHQQKIFERFYRISDTIEQTFPGLGIGLYISNEIIKRHRGQLWVESSKGKGATFSFTLPLDEHDTSPLT